LVINKRSPVPTHSLLHNPNSPKNWWTLGILLLGILGILGILGLLGIPGIFVGQALLLHRGQAPLIALLQDAALVRPLVENQFGIDWNTWVSDPAINRRIMTGFRAAS